MVKEQVKWSADYVALGLAALAFVLHAACAGRYDVFRDELYFIVCGRQPAFGYVDQPPLIPLLSAGFYALGHNAWMLRLPATLAAGALVWLAVRFARLLGGGTFAAIGAGVCVTIAPMLMGIVAVFNTTVFDPLAWTLIAYLLVKATRDGDRPALLWCGVVAGIDFEAKYALYVWAIALVVGLLATPERRIFRDRMLWLGAAIAIVIGLPSILWQATHGWPFLELAAAARAKNTDIPPLNFIINQVLVMNPLLAPVWIAGVVAPFVIASLKPVRFLAIAFLASFALTLITHGKDYYIASTYPTVFILGAVAWAHWFRKARARIGLAVWGGLAVALSAAISPMALPVLSVEGLRAYIAHSPFKPQQQEKSFKGTLLPQVFADQLGWHDYTDQVGAAWRKIPADVRARTGIKVENYGEAAALDIYGPKYDLPPALSGHNQYYQWGLRGQKPVNLLVVQNNPDRLEPYCQKTVILGETYSRDAMAYENGKTIALCQGLKVDIVKLWPELKNFS
ncbi:glycosyltransferase family 39 protein [Asticcacaulis taihuensis]|uniref:Dolichyl-phosphate-mannose-protein mannosyltransferase n=2 Tax=Asticcacaulis taihuensis TaxID=260084 RepID=A0A1G4TMW5_9CAUL|nr:Dolichyl-phosphate-mannose-protein mannosyltransferase [Asticcacaulis taihuensis]